MLNNKLKNKLILSFLMALNIISIHAAPAIVVQRNGVETVLNLRQTVPERVKLAWKKLDPNVKNVITGAAYSLTMMAIVMHMQSNQFSANDFKLTKSSEIDIKFDDLIGLTRPKEEIKDFIDYAKDPASFNKMGAEPIKGLLLYGPPGTGKTELARATAKRQFLIS